MKDLRSRLESELAEKKILIMAHRGVCGANIIENTMEAFELALRQGADILEMDVFRTTDGELFIFHDGTEGYMLGKNCSVKEMTAEEVREQRLINKTGSRLEHGIETLDAVLEQFKGRCLINLDRCWWCWPEVFAAVKRHEMEDQIIFKSAPEKQYLDCIEAWEKPLMYMPIIWNEEEYERAAARNLNIVAVESTAWREDSPVLQREFTETLRKKGVHAMVNALTLASPVYDPETFERNLRAEGSRFSLVNGNFYLVGGHDDDTSVLGHPEQGWGWLMDRGFDIIQTDWARELSLYRASRLSSF